MKLDGRCHCCGVRFYVFTVDNPDEFYEEPHRFRGHDYCEHCERVVRARVASENMARSVDGRLDHWKESRP